ncbi:hypothetical protein [Pseudorhodobacter sp.]|uniref:hypothetical protein n=1 Tax=Pseudorhodobacter sp. TaxID=1934400 RepID=UPI002AFDDEE8|nr:hypothetical protein [Pseudorhodobacter sp.]
MTDDHLDELLDAWEMAKTAYQQVLGDGVDRSAIALSRDKNYNTLLRAGQRIFLLGGASAVSLVARRLGKQSIEASAVHFERLWQGLLPATIGRTC